MAAPVLTQAEIDEIGSLTSRLRQIVDDGEGALAERVDNFKALNNRLDTLEAKQGRVELNADDDDLIDLEERRAARRKARDQKVQLAALRNMVAKSFDMRQISADERGALVPLEGKDGQLNSKLLNLKSLNLTDDTLGGFFVLPEVVTNELIRNVVVVSPIRQLARVRTTGANSLQIPVLTSQTSVGWIAETATRPSSSDPKIGMKEIPTHEASGLILFSRQLLEDSFFDFPGELSYEFGLQFAKLEAAAFINGDGIGKPLGILKDPTLTTTYKTQSAGAGALAADDMINMFYADDAFSFYEPNAQWLMNRKTLGVVRKFKDTTNQYIWQPSYASSEPSTILGRPYMTAVDMPDIATGAVSVICGDFRQGYTVVDRSQVAVQRLNELYATTAQVGMLAYKRVGGMLVKPEALRCVKIQ
jgi:HK97 family phage major capsid protein